MALRFTVLASGSSGNASLVDAGGFGVLLDIGLGPRQLASRLAAVGASWRHVHAVLLTHTHSDHWNDRTLAHLLRLGIPLYCHADHHRALQTYGSAFAGLHAKDLVRAYVPGEELVLAPTLRCRAVPLRHDSGDTHGFRLEGPADLFGQPLALAYAADLGTWTPDLARSLADVDLLALEFNHDVSLERNSGRSPYLIARVLGDDGHLSNAQAAALLEEIVRLSPPGRLRHVVQLHLSRDCNRPYLAAEAAHGILAGQDPAVELHTASQFHPSATLTLGLSSKSARASRRQSRGERLPAVRRNGAQPWLPGLDAERLESGR
jgi:phosphoribosyl 1,2-cyclic phosphodiesterase